MVSLRLQKKKQELLEKCPDPRNPLGKINFQRKEYSLSCPPTYGIVADNKDPDCLGTDPIVNDWAKKAYKDPDNILRSSSFFILIFKLICLHLVLVVSRGLVSCSM